MPYDYFEPISIEAVRADHRLLVEWSDGHHSSYDFEYLRWRCPCAICQGEGGMPGVLSLTKELREDQIEMIDLRMVGRYAIAPTWQDGHDTGIYAFEYLRAICPCDDCQYPQVDR
jgi:DUF971 family protein